MIPRQLITPGYPQGFKDSVCKCQTPVIGEPARRFHHRPRRSQRAPVDQPAYWLKISVPLVPPKPKELLMA